MSEHVFDEDLPGEHIIAKYRQAQVTLTNLRVRYQGQGVARREASFVRLADVTSVGLVYQRGISRPFFLLPGTLAIAVFVVMLLTGDPFIFGIGILLAVVILPIGFFTPGLFLRIATPGDVLQVRVPHQFASEARAFLSQVETARHEGKAAATDAATSAMTPTATPYTR